MVDLSNYGFLPGAYFCKCSEAECQTVEPTTKRYGEFMGAKRSWRCKACAMKTYIEQHKAQKDPARKSRAPQLVRDRMTPRPDFHEANERVSPALATTLLIAKVHTEIEEVALDLKNAEEYADVLEALMSLAMLNGVDWQAIKAAREEKRARKGGLQCGNLWIPEEFMEAHNERAA